MEAKYDAKNKTLVITIPCQEPTPSASGKTLVVASTHGNVALPGVTIAGKPVKLGLNAYISAK